MCRDEKVLVKKNLSECRFHEIKEVIKAIFEDEQRKHGGEIKEPILLETKSQIFGYIYHGNKKYISRDYDIITIISDDKVVFKIKEYGIFNIYTYQTIILSSLELFGIILLVFSKGQSLSTRIGLYFSVLPFAYFVQLMLARRKNIRIMKEIIKLTKDIY